MRIGYNTWSMAKVPYSTFLPGLHEIGYTAVTISVIPHYGIGGQRVPNAAELETLTTDDRRRMKQELETRGLELSAIVGNQSMVGDDAGQVERQLQSLRDSINLCVEIKPDGQHFVPTMNTTSGGHASEFDARRQQLVDNLGALADYASQQGVVVCIEPHVSGAIDTPERASWLVQTLNRESCKIDFDISHFEVQMIPMEESIPIVLPLSRSVEIKDQNARYVDNVDAAGSTGNAGGPLPSTPPSGWRIEGNGLGKAADPKGRPLEYQFLLGGEGDFDLVKYLRLMQQGGWTGAVGFEASVQCQQRPGYDGMAVAANVYRWMAKGWDEARVPRD